MTKANDLASLLDANGDVVSSALDNVPPSNDASALSTGTLPDGRFPATLPAVSGANLTGIPTPTLTSLGLDNHDDITVDGSGNVGIKNPNPSTPLDVTTLGGANWVAKFQNNSAGNSYGVSISEPSGATAGYPLLRVGQGFSPYADYLRVNTNGNSGFGGNPSTLARVNIVTTSRDKAALRMKRSIYNWFQYGVQPVGAYIHIKTGLKIGGAGNVHPTMSMFDIKGYNYSGEIIDSKIGFHNWSGSAYALIMQNYGNRAAAVAPYASTDDYVVLVVNCGTNYPGFTIDWHQAFEYGFVDVGVLNYTDSSSTSGVY